MKLWGLNSRKESKVTNVLKIGVMGTARGVGTTHLAVMLANYYANGCGKKTCLVEFSGHKDFMRLCVEAGLETKDIKHFFLKGIDFRVCDSAKAVAGCMAVGYEVVIIDMYCEKEETLEELKRCDIRLLVGATDLWKIGRLKKLLSEMQGAYGSLAMLKGDAKSIRKLQKEYNVGLLEIPVEPSPLAISSKGMYDLKHFLDEAGKR